MAGDGYFSGKLLYENRFTVFGTKTDTNTLYRQFGRQVDIFMHQGNYREQYSAGKMKWQLYVQKENTVYYSMGAGDTLHWFNALQTSNRCLKSIVTPNADTILGIPCDELAMYYLDKTIRFYYHADTLKINPQWYRDFTYANKNESTEKMKAWYLKYSMETNDFTLEMTATKIEATEPDADLFTIPSKAVLIADKR